MNCLNFFWIKEINLNVGYHDNWVENDPLLNWFPVENQNLISSSSDSEVDIGDIRLPRNANSMFALNNTNKLKTKYLKVRWWLMIIKGKFGKLDWQSWTKD